MKTVVRWREWDGAGLMPDRRYRYEGLASGFTAEIEVDEAGLALGYLGVFVRP
jgi:uncharacterized protein